MVCGCVCVCVCVQVSEQQLNEAIAQAVENSKLKKDKSQWSMEGMSSTLQEALKWRGRQREGGRERGKRERERGKRERERETASDCSFV